VLTASGVDHTRCITTAEAMAAAAPGDAVLALADGYPHTRTPGVAELLDAARTKEFRVYAEYPDAVPGVALAAPRATRWERTVVASDAFAPDLEKHRILMIHGCRYLPAVVPECHLAIARVAGFDTAVYGLPADPEQRPAMRQRRTSYWDLTRDSRIADHLEDLRAVMLPGV
jgi:hypothetical protein